MLRKASEEYSEQKANFEGEISKLKFDHSGEIENLYLENERRLKDLLEKHNKDLKVKLFLMISEKSGQCYLNFPLHTRMDENKQSYIFSLV